MNNINFQSVKTIFADLQKLHSMAFVLEIKGIENYVHFVAEQLTPKYIEIKTKYQLNGRFLMKDFHRICRAEKIVVRSEKMSKKIGGTYLTNGKDRAIILCANLTGQTKRLIAAHELAHHLLHSESLLAGDLGFRKGEKNQYSDNGYIAEWEADIFSAMLNSEVK